VTQEKGLGTPLLLELIGEDRLRRILREFSEATGASVIALDQGGDPIRSLGDTRVGSFGGRPLCLNLIHVELNRRGKCQERDRLAVGAAVRQRAPYVFQCEDSGLWEFCVAVRANGGTDESDVIGYLFGGQVADATLLDQGFYEKKADALEVDRDRFIGLLRENAVWSKDAVMAYARLLGMLASDLSALAQQHRKVHAIYGAARAIATGPGLGLAPVLEQILLAVEEALQPSAASVWLLDPVDSTRLFCAHSHNGIHEHMPPGQRPYFSITGSAQEMGVVGRVAAGILREVIPDLQLHSNSLRYPEVVRAMGTRSFMAVRLPSDGPLVGVLEVTSTEPGRYTADDLSMLRVMGDDIVAVIYSAQLYEDLQTQQARVVPDKEREISRLRTLLQMDDAFAPGMDEEGVLKHLLRSALALMPPDLEVLGHVRRVDPETRSAELIHTDEIFAPGYSSLPDTRSASDPLTGRVTFPGEVVYLPDTATSPEFVAERDALEGSQREFYGRVKSLLICPVRRNTDVGGHLTLYRTSSGGFDESLRDAVERLCERAGIALTGASARRHADDLARLRTRLETIGAQLSAVSTRDQIIEDAARHARDLVGGSCALIVALLPFKDNPDDSHLRIGTVVGPPDYPSAEQRALLLQKRVVLRDLLRRDLEGGMVVEVSSRFDTRYSFILGGTQRALLAPMKYRYGGAMLEGIIIAESKESRPFGELRREVTRLIASQSAVHVARTRAVAEDHAVFVHQFTQPMSQLRRFVQQCEARRESLSADLGRIVDDARGIYDQFDAYRVAFGQIHQLEPEHTPLSSLLGAALTSVRRGVAGRIIELECAAECGARLVYTDPNAMRGVIIELIRNAAKNDPGKSRIQVRCACDDDKCTIRVRDHGVAIPSEQYRHLFDLRTPIGGPGEQASGIGMWMVRAVLERHGGSIHLEWPDKTPKDFVVSLPLCQGASTPRVQARVGTERVCESGPGEPMPDQEHAAAPSSAGDANGGVEGGM
jgi:signal transduction histidine kinase/ligand-binding sensor protein